MASQSFDHTFERPPDLTSESKSAFYNGQAKTINAAAVLLRTVDNEVVLVKPSYRNLWHLPGGLLDANESPRQAAQREVQEELGLDVRVNGLLCVDFKTATVERPACHQFVFD